MKDGLRFSTECKFGFTVANVPDQQCFWASMFDRACWEMYVVWKIKNGSCSNSSHRNDKLLPLSDAHKLMVVVLKCTICLNYLNNANHVLVILFNPNLFIWVYFLDQGFMKERWNLSWIRSNCVYKYLIIRMMSHLFLLWPEL